MSNSSSAIAADPIASSDNSTVMQDVDVAGLPDATITDLDVQISTDHTWVGDLVVSVTSPAGTTVELINNIGGPGFGCAGNGLEITLDDEAAATYADLDNTCNNDPAAAGDFQPIQALSAFDGENLAGTWTVSVQDLAGGDGGTVNVTLLASASGSIPFPVPAGVTVIGNSQPYTLLGFDPCGPATLTYS